jgi:hypothetical protein
VAPAALEAALAQVKQYAAHHPAYQQPGFLSGK